MRQWTKLRLPDGIAIPEPRVIHRESGWGIAVFESGLLILEQSADVPPRHMRVADQKKILSLWKMLAAGNIDTVMAES